MIKGLSCSNPMTIFVKAFGLKGLLQCSRCLKLTSSLLPLAGSCSLLFLLCNSVLPFSWLWPLLGSYCQSVFASTIYLHVWNILKFTSILLPVPLFGTLAVYENLHRFLDIEFFKKTKEETSTWKNYFDFVSTPIAAWIFMTFPSKIASCRWLFESRDQYIVAETIFVEGRDQRIREFNKKKSPYFYACFSIRRRL